MAVPPGSAAVTQCAVQPAPTVTSALVIDAGASQARKTASAPNSSVTAKRLLLCPQHFADHLLAQDAVGLGLNFDLGRITELDIAGTMALQEFSIPRPSPLTVYHALQPLPFAFQKKMLGRS
jgi:hypothetical protein